MMSNLALFLLVAFSFHSIDGLFFGDDVYPNWNRLSVTAMKFDTLPMTESDAKNAEWVMNKDACSESSFFYGRRYLLNNEFTTMLLYDVKGKVAGIQMALPLSEIATTQRWIGKAAIQENNMYVLTAYFTDPKTICSGNRTTKNGYVGDKLFLSIGKDEFMEIPLKESDVDATKWGNGRCFVGMGQHYWYKSSGKMLCDDFFPYFLLYNSGELNAFGFASSGNVDSNRVEHPAKSAFGVSFRITINTQCFSWCIISGGSKQCTRPHSVHTRCYRRRRSLTFSLGTAESGRFEYSGVESVVYRKVQSALELSVI